MDEKHSVLLSKLTQEHKLEIVHAASDYAETLIFSREVARPGLQFTGFYEYHDPLRALLYGKQENTYLLQLDDSARERSIEELMRRRPCALIACHGIRPLQEMLTMAKRYDVNLLATPMATSEYMARLITSLHVHLAPRQTIHGVLVDVYGEGVLITGDSGIGKSETALELIKRGHRLIADDAVEIRQISAETLVGQSPPLIRHYMEFRGIGVVNARDIYGVGAVKASQSIHLVVNLEIWDPNKTYTRLGTEEEFTEILEVPLPSIMVPVRPGRNLAVIVELAAMNNRQKKLGYNAARALEKRHDEMIDSGGFQPEWI
ncbi:MAG: HPr(Ser) kinase/phosphatase [Oscillospiraceae bacterium]|jgi:HPr kinase/phosphorylase|nr:HPr(Ser) kinase/phosphatase [Oscillospiraceae bacterium]